MEHLISWQEAVELIISSAKAKTSEQIPVRHCLNSYTHKEIQFDTPYPPFSIALTKGYAVNSGWVKGKLSQGEFPVRIEIEGQISPSLLKERHPSLSRAFKVDAGTAMPDWLDSVVPEEEAQVQGNQLIITLSPQERSEVMPAGRVFPKSYLIPANEVITFRELALLVANGVEKIHVWEKPLVALQVFGTALTDSPSENIPRTKARDVIIPIFRALADRWRCHFVSLGVTESFSVETLNTAFQQADLVITSGFVNRREWTALHQLLNSQWKVIIAGTKHPLGRFLTVAHSDDKWFFFIPYDPPFFLAACAMLLHPALLGLTGKPRIPYPLQEGTLAEDKEEVVKGDNLWLGVQVKPARETEEAEIKLISQISTANLHALKEGNVFAITRVEHPFHARGENISFIDYASVL